MKKVIAFIFVSFLLASCGGAGGSFSTSREVVVSAEVVGGYVDTRVSDYRNDEVELRLGVSSSDIFQQSVLFRKVVLEYKDLSNRVMRTVEYPLGFSLSAGQRRGVKVALFTIADKLSAPYIYLNPVNPTTFGAGYAEEILAVPLTLVLGQGECRKERQCRIVDGREQCQDVDVCKRDFSGTFPEDITIGTCKVIAGGQSVEEKTFGILEGGGSGVVQGRNIRVSFNEGVPQGVYVVAQCLSKIKPLSRPYILLRLAYGDSLYESTQGGLIRDKDGRIVGEVDANGNIRFSIALTAKSFPFVAFYYYGPTLGGELMGYGNGGSTYRLRTRYSPVDASSVKVVADDGRGFSVAGIVQWVDSATGEITFTFPRAIPEGVPIFVQYRLTDIFQKISVYVETDKGRISAGEVQLRVRQ